MGAKNGKSATKNSKCTKTELLVIHKLVDRMKTDTQTHHVKHLQSNQRKCSKSIVKSNYLIKVLSVEFHFRNFTFIMLDNEVKIAKEIKKNENKNL